jgi:acyl-CoA thioesterase-1
VLGTLTRYIAAAILALALLSCSGEDPQSPKQTTEKQTAEKQTTEEQTSEEQTAEKPPPAYVSLGDSLAVGVGASDPEGRGYAALYRDALAEEARREVRFVQLGVSGETSESFIDYPQRASSQLALAEKALKRYPGATVTLSLGANDLLRTADATDAEREAAISRYGQNLDYILKRLGVASDPEPRIAVLALYNPAPGSFTDEWVGRLNREIRAVSEANGASVAAGDRAFRGHVREYVHYPGDIHPTDKGYAALARAFARATGVA